jgi:hypothetical protein
MATCPFNKIFKRCLTLIFGLEIIILNILLVGGFLATWVMPENPGKYLGKAFNRF